MPHLQFGGIGRFEYEPFGALFAFGENVCRLRCTRFGSLLLHLLLLFLALFPLLFQCCQASHTLLQRLVVGPLAKIVTTCQTRRWMSVRNLAGRRACRTNLPLTDFGI